MVLGVELTSSLHGSFSSEMNLRQFSALSRLSWKIRKTSGSEILLVKASRNMRWKEKLLLRVLPVLHKLKLAKVLTYTALLYVTAL